MNRLVFLVIALLAIGAFASKVRLNLNQGLSDSSEFFQFKERKTYIHNNLQYSKNDQGYAGRNDYFMAHLRTAVFDTDKKSTNYVIDINAQQSIYFSDNKASQIATTCNQQEDDCNVIKSKMYATVDGKPADLALNYLVYNWYGPYQVKSTKTGDDLCYMEDKLTIENQRNHDVTKVGLFGAKASKVTNFGTNPQKEFKDKLFNSWQGVLALSVDAGVNAAYDLKAAGQGNEWNGEFKKAHSFLNQLQESKLIDRRLFALYFAREPTFENAEHAYYHQFITFGEYEPYLCMSDLGQQSNFDRKTTWIVNRELDERKRFDMKSKTKIDENRQLWKVELAHFKKKDSNSESPEDDLYSTSVYKYVTFDTATFDYLVPKAQLEKLIKSIGCQYHADATPEKRMKCNKDDLPPLEFKFTDKSLKANVAENNENRNKDLDKFETFYLTEEMYSYKDKNGNKYLYFLPLDVKADYVESGSDYLNTFVFGRMFLTHYYAIFDVDNQWVTLDRAYLPKPDTFEMGQTTKWMIICFGIFTFVLSVIALLSILAPIKQYRQEIVKQTVRTVVAQPQVVPQYVVQQQQPVYQSYAPQFQAPQSPRRGQSPTRFR